MTVTVTQAHVGHPLGVLERKVGPRGYIHGWHFVGIPGVGDRVHHPQLGKGTITHATAGQVHVKFDSGHAQPFEHRAGPGPGKFVKGGEEGVTADVPMMLHRLGQVREKLGTRSPADRKLEAAAAALHGELSAPGFDPATADLHSIGGKLAAVEAAATGRHSSGPMRSTIGGLRDEIESMAHSRGQLSAVRHDDHAVREDAMSADATRLAGHAQTARQLATDVRSQLRHTHGAAATSWSGASDYGQGTGDAPDKLEEAAGHFDAGWRAEGRTALRRARQALSIHGASAQREAYRNQGARSAQDDADHVARARAIGDRADKLEQHLTYGFPLRDTGGTSVNAGDEVELLHDTGGTPAGARGIVAGVMGARAAMLPHGSGDGPGVNFGDGDVRVTRPADTGDQSLHHIRAVVAHTGAHQWHTVHGGATRDLYLSQIRDRGQVHTAQSEGADLTEAPKGARDLHAHALANGWDTLYLNHAGEDGKEIHHVTATNPDTRTTVKQTWLDGKRDARTPQQAWVNGKQETAKTPPTLAASMAAISGSPRTSHIPEAAAPPGAGEAGSERAALLARAEPHIDKLPQAVPLADATDDQLRDAISKGNADQAAAVAEDAEYARLRAKYPDGPEHIASLRALEARQGTAGTAGPFHVTTVDSAGRAAYHTIATAERRDQLTADARKRGMTVTVNSGPHDLAGLPKAARDLHAHATANGWDTSVYTGTQQAGGRSVTGVSAYHPEKGLKVTQGWLEGRKQGGPSLQQSMNQIGAARRTEHTSSALTPTGEQPWEPLSPKDRGAPGAPDEGSARNMSGVLGRLRAAGALTSGEDTHLSAARDAIAAGDHAAAADHAAQAVSSFQARSAGDSPAGKAADKVFRWSDQRRGNHDQVNYWQSGMNGTFSRQVKDPEAEAAEWERQGRQADQDAARAARQQDHDDAVRQRAVDRSPAVRNAASHEQYVRAQRERNRAGFGGSGGTDWKPQTTMGRYSEHRVFNGRQLSISHTPNGVYTARIDGQHIGHHKDRDRAKQMAEDRARGAALGGTTPGARARLGRETPPAPAPTPPPVPEPPQVVPAENALGTAQARSDAVHKARQIHFAESTGLNGAAINARDMRAPAEAAPHIDAAREHLLNGDFAAADVALSRAGDASREAHATRAVNAITAARAKVSKAATTRRDTLPPMVAVDGSARADSEGNHTLTTVDHLGREHQVQLGNDGNVTVTHEGRSLTAPAGESPTRVSRELAGQLAAAHETGPGEPGTATPAPVARPDHDYAAHLPAGLTAGTASPEQLAGAASRGRAVDEALATTGSGAGHAPRDIAVSMARSDHADAPDGPLPLRAIAGTSRAQAGGGHVTTVVDHLGREYHVGTGPTGHVTVGASGGRTLDDSGRHGDSTRVGNSSMDVARDLAGQLNGHRYEKPAGRMTKTQRAGMPVVSATQGRLVSGTDLAGHAEAGVHLDRAAKALTEGDTQAAAGHLAVARMSLGSLGGELGDRIENQRTMLGGKQPRLERGQHRVLAEGTHNGAPWQAIEANTPGVTPIGSQYNRYYNLTDSRGGTLQTSKGPGPHAAVEKMQAGDATRQQQNATAEQARRSAIDDVNRIEAAKGRDAFAPDKLMYTQVEDAWKAAHRGENVTPSQRRAWAYNGPSSADQRSDWYKAGVSAKLAHQPMSAVPDHLHAAELDQAASRINTGGDHGGEHAARATGVADRMRLAAQQMRGGDHQGARSSLANASAGAGGQPQVRMQGVAQSPAAPLIASHLERLNARHPAAPSGLRTGYPRSRETDAGPAATRADLIDKTADGLTQGSGSGGRGGGVLEDTRQSLRSAAAALRAGDQPAAARHLQLADAAGMRTADGHPAVDAVRAHRWDVEGHGTTPLGAQVGSLADQARAVGSPQVAQHLTNAARYLSGGEADRGRAELTAAHALAPGPDEPGGELHDSTDLGTRIRRHIAQLDTVTATRRHRGGAAAGTKATQGVGDEVKQLAGLVTGSSEAHASVRRLLGNAAAALDNEDSARARGALDMARRYATGEFGPDIRSIGGVRLADGTEAWRPIERHLSRLPR